MSALRAVPRRPSRAELEAIIRETGGNMSLLATTLGVTRQTCYSWVASAGLRDLVGIREAGVREAGEPEPEAAGPHRVVATVRLDGQVWKGTRIVAVEDDVTTGEIVEATLRAFLARRS